MLKKPHINWQAFPLLEIQVYDYHYLKKHAIDNSDCHTHSKVVKSHHIQPEYVCHIDQQECVPYIVDVMAHGAIIESHYKKLKFHECAKSINDFKFMVIGDVSFVRPYLICVMRTDKFRFFLKWMWYKFLFDARKNKK